MENVRQTYDLFVQNQVKHTSHTLEWLPITHVDSDDTKFEFQYFLMGTHHDESFEDTVDKLQLARLRLPTQSLKLEELQALSSVQSSLSRLEIVKEFDHQDEVIKARAMPQHLSTVASMTNSGNINIYNVPEIISPQEQCEVQRLKTTLIGLEEESFALSWNKQQQGLICSASAKTIAIWDINKQNTPTVTIAEAHTDAVNDVKFSGHPAHGGNVMISTADDGHFKVWDMRDTSRFTMTYKSAEDSLCVGQFNPINENLFVVAGDSSGNICLWDMRMQLGALHEFCHHSKQVTLLEWCPSNEYLLASGSDDNKVYIWDSSLLGMEQGRHDYEDGPPELVFPHMYHTSAIEDLQWCPSSSSHFNMAIASVETNMLH